MLCCRSTGNRSVLGYANPVDQLLPPVSWGLGEPRTGMFSLSGDMHELPWLLDTEQGGCKLADSAAGAWASRQAQNGHLILSVVNETLSNLKRVRKGQLVRSDMSVSVHRVLRVDEAERLIFVGACPVNIDALVAGVAYVPGASLVLSLKSLDREALLSMRFFLHEARCCDVCNLGLNFF